jgi:hypothetical protein
MADTSTFARPELPNARQKIGKRPVARDAVFATDRASVIGGS